MFKEGDIINHKVFGKGEVIFVDGEYFEVSFDEDSKLPKYSVNRYRTRMFREDTIKPFLVTE